MAALLWGELSEERAAANLRQAIWRIRLVFNDLPPLIEADRDTVWIRRENISEIPSASRRCEELLEGICIDEEAFEDWLRQHRVTAAESRSDRIAGSVSFRGPDPSESSLPQVAVFPSIGQFEVERACSDIVTSIVINTLNEQRCVDVFDLRDGDRAAFDPSTGSPAFGLFPRVTTVDGKLCFMLSMKNLVTGQVLWSRWLENCMYVEHRFTQEFLYSQVAEIANAVHDQVHRHCRGLRAGGMFGAVQEVLSHSKEGQARAKPWLAEAAEESGVARAWLMYTFAVAHAERHGGLDPSSLEELQNHCQKARDAEPENPIVRAIIGHINAFVFRDFEEAEIHHSIARKMGWNHPVVWTLSAMHANYTDRPTEAYRFSSRAMSQSIYSPNRFYFEGPYSISCSLTNRHQEAIAVGNAILAKKPGFLAVMRHLVASQIHTGDLNEARANIREIRLKDPQFARREISASDYPLPSTKSVELINSAFEIAGI